MPRIACRAMNSAKIGFIFIERRIADAVLPANFTSRHPSFLLLYHANDLLVAELPHGGVCLHARECVMISFIHLLIRDEFYSKLDEEMALRSHPNTHFMWLSSC